MTMTYEQEIREALKAADNALYHLHHAQKLLCSARNWGIYDCLGGGFLSTLIKHSRMNSARSEMEDARIAVRRFSSELNDVAVSAQVNLDTDDFLAFADCFLDGFFSDFMMQNRISRAREQVDMAIGRITALRTQLSHILHS